MRRETVGKSRVTPQTWVQPRHFWLQVVALVLTMVAFFLNLLDAKLTHDFLVVGRNRSEAMVLIAALVSPFAMLSAIAWPVAVHIAKRGLTLRRSLVWLTLALVSIAGWPVSCSTSFTNTPLKLDTVISP